jgi:hypothetical protein
MNIRDGENMHEWTYFIYEQSNHIDRILILYVNIKTTSIPNDHTKHVVRLLLVMGHAVNTLYKYIHTDGQTYIQTDRSKTMSPSWQIEVARTPTTFAVNVVCFA